MGTLAGFVLEDGRAIFRPVGAVTFDDLVVMVADAIAITRSNRARELLVDTTALIGFSPPTVFERFLAAVKWAEESRSSVRLAMVAPEEMIDPKKFGVTVALNRGMVSNIFASEVDARAWLDTGCNL